jgi:hypothetical protein
MGLCHECLTPKIEKPSNKCDRCNKRLPARADPDLIVEVPCGSDFDFKFAFVIAIIAMLAICYYIVRGGVI